MKAVFADTSYYVAVLSPKDTAHAAAVHWSQTVFGLVITSEFVLTELGNGLSATPQRKAFADFVSFLRNDPNTLVVSGSTKLFDAALELYARRADKNWSLTDCTSFVIMKEQSVSSALTSDHHFEQAGFTILLKDA